MRTLEARAVAEAVSRQGAGVITQGTGRLLFIGFHGSLGLCTSMPDIELVATSLGAQGFSIRFSRPPPLPLPYLIHELVPVIRNLRWADAVIVGAFSGRRGWMSFVVARIARRAGIPAVLVLRCEGLHDYAHTQSWWRDSTLRLATRVVAFSQELENLSEARRYVIMKLPGAVEVALPAALQVNASVDPAMSAWRALLGGIGATPYEVRGDGCAALALRDLEDVVAIHTEAFPDSAMTQLGRAVLRRYYRWQFAGPHPNPVALGVWRSGQLVGFLFGGLRHGAVSGFVRQSLGTIASGAIAHPGALRRLTLPKLISVVKAMARRSPAPALPGSVDLPPAATQVPEPSFGVLSIAVSPAYRGSGAASDLMAAAEVYANELGCRRMHLTVNPTSERAVAFYEKLGWQRFKIGADWTGMMVKPLMGDRQARKLR